MLHVVAMIDRSVRLRDAAGIKAYSGCARARATPPISSGHSRQQDRRFQRAREPWFEKRRQASALGRRSNDLQGFCGERIAQSILQDLQMPAWHFVDRKVIRRDDMRPSLAILDEALENGGVLFFFHAGSKVTRPR